MNTDLINKVKALLSKTLENGCSEEESQSAIAMANKLITKHNLSMEEVKTTEDVWGEGKIIESGKWTLDISLATEVVENYFFVKGISFGNGLRGTGRKFKLCFYGKKENVIAAKYIFDGLIAAFDNLWIKYRKNTGCEAQYRRVFIQQLTKGFMDKLKAERYTTLQEVDKEKGITSGSTAIVIRNIQEQTIERYKKEYPNVKISISNMAPIYNNDDVAKAGYNAGRNLNINKPISNNIKKSLD